MFLQIVLDGALFHIYKINCIPTAAHDSDIECKGKDSEYVNLNLFSEMTTFYLVFDDVFFYHISYFCR